MLPGRLIQSVVPPRQAQERMFYFRVIDFARAALKALERHAYNRVQIHLRRRRLLVVQGIN